VSSNGLQTLVDPVELVYERLRGTGCEPKWSGNTCRSRCPAPGHEDEHPSCTLKKGDSGAALLTCHSRRCGLDEMLSGLGLEKRELFPGPSWSNAHSGGGGGRNAPVSRAAPPPRNGKAKEPSKTYPTLDALKAARTWNDTLAGSWEYHQPGEEPLFYQVRYDKPNGKKRFLSAHERVDGTWVDRLPEMTLRPLYGVEAAVGADEVFIVEGEACVDALAELEIAAVTSSGGAGSAKHSDWAPLDGKRLYSLADNDDAGRGYISEIVGLLKEPLRDIVLPGLPHKGDNIDFAKARQAEDRSMVEIRREILDLREAAPVVETIAEPEPEVELEWVPFPVGSLPEPLRSIVEEISSVMGCDATSVALPALAICGASVGLSREIRLKNSWSEPPILWTCTIQPSGSMKSPPWRAAVQPLQKIQDELFKEYDAGCEEYERELARYEVAKKTCKNKGDLPEKPKPPSCVRHIVADCTVEAIVPILRSNPRGIIVARDELSAWLGSFNQFGNKTRGTDAAKWCEMFKGAAVTVDRKTGATTIHVPRAATSVCGTIQPEILQKHLGRENFQNGLAARLLLAEPPVHEKKWTDLEMSEDTRQSHDRLIRALVDLKPQYAPDGSCEPIAVTLDDGARKRWIAFYNKHAKRQSGADNPDLKSAFAKLEAYAARIALVLHCVKAVSVPDYIESRIREDVMEDAIRLTEWFIHEIARVYQNIGQAPDGTETAQDDLFKYIEGRGGTVTVRGIAKSGPRRFRGTEGPVRKLLRSLVEAKLGQFAWSTPGSKGGQPAEYFQLTVEIENGTENHA